jgi:hypothetical protein
MSSAAPSGRVAERPHVLSASDTRAAEERSRGWCLGCMLGLGLLATGILVLATWVVLPRGAPPAPEPPTVKLEPSWGSSMDDALREAREYLRAGRIAFRPREEMVQGKPEEVRVEVSSHPSPSPFGNLPPGFRVETIPTSGVMKVELLGDAEQFRIRPLSTDQQALMGRHTDWRWVVTPLVPGRYKLHLRVTAVLWLSNGRTESSDIVVRDSIINVRVNRRWILTGFLKRNWQWLLGSPVLLGAAAWVLTRLRRPKQRSAGF